MSIAISKLLGLQLLLRSLLHSSYVCNRGGANTFTTHCKITYHTNTYLCVHGEHTNVENDKTITIAEIVANILLIQ